MTGQQRGDPPRVTIKEIARMCGVSMQTVSRVINRRPDVSPETRAAVEAAIAEVGFQPSAVARSLVKRRSYTLGVIAAGLRYFGVAQTLNGITEEAEASGYALLLKEVSGSGDVDVLKVVDVLMSHRVEGIIVAAPDLGHADVRDHLPNATPPIVFLKSDPSPAFPTILIDNAGGALIGTRHLIALGRRKIAHIAGPLDWHEARDRQQGYLDALHEAGLQPGPTRVGNWTSASGAAVMAALLDEAPDIDGLFSANDQMALGAMSVLHERGIAIPDRVAIVGFDGMEEGAYFSPSLATLRQPLRELGRLAVRELLTTIDRGWPEVPARAMTLATEFVAGESAPMPQPGPTALSPTIGEVADAALGLRSGPGPSALGGSGGPGSSTPRTPDEISGPGLNGTEAGQVVASRDT